MGGGGFGGPPQTPHHTIWGGGGWGGGGCGGGCRSRRPAGPPGTCADPSSVSPARPQQTRGSGGSTFLQTQSPHCVLPPHTQHPTPGKELTCLSFPSAHTPRIHTQTQSDRQTDRQTRGAEGQRLTAVDGGYRWTWVEMGRRVCVCGWVGVCVWICVCVCVCVCVRMDGWMDGWVVGWTNGWTDGWIN